MFVVENEYLNICQKLKLTLEYKIHLAYKLFLYLLEV